MGPEETNAATAIATIAARRARTWRLLAESLAPPTQAFSDRLCDGAWQHELRDAVAWLGDSAAPMERHLPPLDVLHRRAERHSDASHLEGLRSAWRPPVEAATTFHGRLTEVAGLCDDEASAWAGGDFEGAKALRRREGEIIEADLVTGIPPWCVSVIESDASATYRAVARLLASWLSVESGRDFDTTLFGPVTR